MRAMWSIFIVSLIFSIAGIYVVFKGKVEVQPLRVLNPTNFNTHQEIGAVVMRRFWQELHQEKLVILGSSPFLQQYDDVWRGFLSVAKENKIDFDLVFEQEGLRKLYPDSRKLDWEQVQISLASVGRVLVHVVSTDEAWQEVQDRTIGGFVLFQHLLPVTNEKKNLLNQICGQGLQNEKMKINLACLAENSLSHGKKKKFNPDQITATVERHGPREHLLYIHVPQK